MSSVILEMCRKVQELSEKESLIVSEDDREFILGLQMLVDMEEPIDIQYVDRVTEIYNTTLQNAEPWRA
jgi:hypothetical protein